MESGLLRLWSITVEHDANLQEQSCCWSVLVEKERGPAMEGGGRKYFSLYQGLCHVVLWTDR